MAAVGTGHELVRVRTVLAGTRLRSGVLGQRGALAERARGVDRVHGHAAGRVVGAQQPTPARVHGQVAGARAAGAPRAEHLAVRQAYGGHRAGGLLVDRVQGAAVGVQGEERRVGDAGDGARAGDPAGRRVVGRQADALAAAVDRGVGAEVERVGARGLARAVCAGCRCARGAGRRGGFGIRRCRGRGGDRDHRRRSAQGADETPPAPALA